MPEFKAFSYSLRDGLNTASRPFVVVDTLEELDALELELSQKQALLTRLRDGQIFAIVTGGFGKGPVFKFFSTSVGKALGIAVVLDEASLVWQIGKLKDVIWRSALAVESRNEMKALQEMDELRVEMPPMWLRDP